MPCLQLNVAGGHLPVSHFLWPKRDGAIDLDDKFLTKTVGEIDVGLKCPIGIKRQLKNPSAISEIDEHNATQIAYSVNPAGHSYNRTCISRPKASGEAAGPQSCSKKIGIH